MWLVPLPNVTSLLLYANFLIEVRKDGQGARTQLQLAAKNNPTFIDRYFIYVGGELAKKMKTEGVGLDLLGYVDFRRNYRYGGHCYRKRNEWHASDHQNCTQSTEPNTP